MPDLSPSARPASCVARAARPVFRVAVLGAVIGAVLAAALGARPARQLAPAGDELPGRAARIERALDAIRAENVRADLHFIASDELAGRDTPSVGQRVAARFIRARLQRLGFEPGAPEGFFYEYPLELNRVDPERSHVEIGKGGEAARFALGEDYWFSSRELRDTEVSAPVVYLGEGKADDVEEAELEGRWALVEDTTLSRGAERGLRRTLEARGALGLLMTPGQAYKGEPYEVRFERWVPRLLRGGVAWPSGAQSDDDDPFLSTYLAPAAGSALLADPRPPVGTVLAGVTVTEHRKRAGDDGVVQLENVCGFWRGSHPELAREVIIVSAHYDHVGVRADGEVYNGADDNGSGTTGLLALAEALAVHGPMDRSVLLLWVSGEEKGLFGSRAWASDPWLPEGCRAVCDVNIDMVGRNAPDKLLITPTSKRPEYNGLVRLAERHAPSEGFPELGSCDSYWSRSDHAMFAEHMGIPVTFLFSDVHEDYHQVTDTPDKVDYDKVRRVARLVFRMLADLQVPDMDLDSPEFPSQE